MNRYLIPQEGCEKQGEPPQIQTRLSANIGRSRWWPTDRSIRTRTASKEQMQEENDAIAALQRDLEAARYAAERAQRQYDAADPENRLVTGELERRWNQALQRVNEIEGRIQSYSADKRYAAATPEEFAGLAAQLDMVWQDPRSDASLKKRIVRTLIEEVVADVDSDAGEVILVIHWKGGLHTEVRVPRRRRGYNNGHTDKEMVEAVSLLANICNDESLPVSSIAMDTEPGEVTDGQRKE